ncbi:3-ketoacyl-ACP reductase [Planctomicrobium sp. SH661]|uniref:3-ketoacyl-ACP reductase n=1 Tax=Planctomicrobium sp. SH661 TaxID=3448124 RepID=UPI003F5C32F6
MSSIALITGGARGIGLGIARELAAAGWKLMLNGVRPVEGVKDTLDQLREIHREIDYCPGDISVHADRVRLVENTLHRFGRIDALINNAGITSPGRKDLLEAGEDAFDKVIGINLKGPHFLTQLVARQMISHRRDYANFRGTVIFISSISAEVVSVDRGDYCLSKAGLGMATKLWAARLAEEKINVYEIRPGIIRSDMTSAVTGKYDRMIADGLTLERRWGESSDIGRAVRTLVSGDLPYATGQVLKIDGGMSIRTM